MPNTWTCHILNSNYFTAHLFIDAMCLSRLWFDFRFFVLFCSPFTQKYTSPGDRTQKAILEKAKQQLGSVFYYKDIKYKEMLSKHVMQVYVPMNLMSLKDSFLRLS